MPMRRAGCICQDGRGWHSRIEKRRSRYYLLSTLVHSVLTASRTLASDIKIMTCEPTILLRPLLPCIERNTPAADPQPKPKPNRSHYYTSGSGCRQRATCWTTLPPRKPHWPGDIVESRHDPTTITISTFSHDRRRMIDPLPTMRAPLTLRQAFRYEVTAPTVSAREPPGVTVRRTVGAASQASRDIFTGTEHIHSMYSKSPYGIFHLLHSALRARVLAHIKTRMRRRTSRNM